jgi:hypothetical protein
MLSNWRPPLLVIPVANMPEPNQHDVTRIPLFHALTFGKHLREKSVASQRRGN